MPGSYPDKIRELALYDGRFDAYQLKAQGCDHTPQVPPLQRTPMTQTTMG